MNAQQIDEQLEVLRTTQIELMSSMIKGLADAVAENNKAIRLITERLTALEKKLDRATEFLPDLGEVLPGNSERLSIPRNSGGSND